MVPAVLGAESSSGWHQTLLFLIQIVPQPCPLNSRREGLSTASQGSCEGEVAARSHRVRLVLPAVELMAVVEDVLVGGVEARLHAVLHDLAGTRWALQFLNLRAEGPAEEAGTEYRPGRAAVS